MAALTCIQSQVDFNAGTSGPLSVYRTITASPRSKIVGAVIKIPNQAISFLIEIIAKAKIIAQAEAIANSYIFPQGALCAATPLKTKATAKKIAISQFKLSAIRSIFVLFLFCAKEIENNTRFIAETNIAK